MAYADRIRPLPYFWAKFGDMTKISRPALVGQCELQEVRHGLLLHGRLQRIACNHGQSFGTSPFGVANQWSLGEKHRRWMQHCR